MIPMDFPERNISLTKPDTMTNDECGSLFVYTDTQQCVSLWGLTWRERFRILFYGRIWLVVVSGKTQPPVFLSAERTVFCELPIK